MFTSISQYWLHFLKILHIPPAGTSTHQFIFCQNALNTSEHFLKSTHSTIVQTVPCVKKGVIAILLMQNMEKQNMNFAKCSY